MSNNKIGKIRWGLIILGIIIILFMSFIFSIIMLFSGSDIEYADGNIALISITGEILSDEDDSLFDDATSSSDIVELIEKADKNQNIKAIILEINSPGGSPVASDEIADAIKNTNKTTIAWIREIGASGAYWVASSSDYIIANKMSITGSIGVFASYLEFAELLDKYNVTYQRLVSGKYKDVGSPFRELTSEEKQILQDKLDKLHDYFIDEVSNNRKIPKTKLEQISTGMFYLGSEALELGLIDKLGGKKDAIAYIENKHGIMADIVEYKKEKSLFDVLSRFMNQNSFYLGNGIGNAYITDKSNHAFKLVT